MASIGTYSMITGIPGWMSPVDFSLFRLLLECQVVEQFRGDLAEFGVYMGKSAVVIGAHLQPGELFTVVDLFEDHASTGRANAQENLHSYEGLTRQTFEHNYLKVHSTLPVIVQGPSQTIAESARPGQHRFVHVDASHLYQYVREDINVARKLLRPDGLIVLDDFRSSHTPGVAAATWQAVGAGLKPIVITDHKMYATWGNADPVRELLAAWLPTTRYEYERQDVAGSEMFRVWKADQHLRKWLPPIAAEGAGRLLRLVQCKLMSGRPADQVQSSRRP